MGLGGGGRQVADALLASSWCELVAVASRKSKRIEAFTNEHPGIAVYDDFRSLIVENQLDALFVAVPPFLRGKYLSLAAERELAVWMLTPPARRFDEALTLAEQFERAGRPLVVWRRWGIEPALLPEAIELPRLSRLFFARGNVMTCREEDLDWRGDSVRAGGGVLLDSGYELLDMLVLLAGVPATVYAVAKGVSRPGTRFPYDTEDTAVVVCQFASGMVAVISACWTSGPPRWELDVHGSGGSLHLGPDEVVCRDRAGKKEYVRQARSASAAAPSIEEFLIGLRSNPGKLRSTMREHLRTMAVIQAAYLSARTGQPESPSRIFEMHQVDEGDLGTAI